MVVIPTIIDSLEKIDKMFEKLETIYLLNKTDNLYFTLLGDITSSITELDEDDEKFSNYGIEKANMLNKKYNKELFYYIYRKRIYSNTENMYMGYERKRGALNQFNKILLNKKIDNNKYFNVNMLDNNKLSIKYVITLDEDTNVSLNSVKELIGCISHPLNKAVVKDNKVVSGYGIMQPRISVDIASTNKSLYAQIFSGVGGFDTYSSIIPDIYQDLFNEASFVGKGIYDLEVFDKILSDAFLDERVLSHDLLEGSYINCAYTSDIELIDEFPSKFLLDTKRISRWARGDIQSSPWLFNKVYNRKNKKVKNPISILSKFKIFDNLSRILLPFNLMIIILLNFLFNINYIWILYPILVIFLPILFFLHSKIYPNKTYKKVVYYNNLLFGGKSIITKSFIMFITIPYYAYLYTKTFIITLYRMIKTKKHLLTWVTYASEKINNKFTYLSYIKAFIPNIIISIIMIIITILTSKYILLIIPICFLSVLFIIPIVDKDIIYDKKKSNKDKEFINELNNLTWKYFEDNLKEEFNYLIPDNYQDNREIKTDFRTSPTALGYSLTSTICAYELNYIDIDKTKDLLMKQLESIDNLDKWNGHLYNWYNIKTKEVLYPHFISSVDSGNFIASLIVVNSFSKKIEDNKLEKITNKLIKNTNFKKLYTKDNIFSIGYDVDYEKLSIYNYNHFASEARLLSFVSIALGQIPVKHWFNLDKSLTSYKNKKGLISWNGTMFEYLMPLLFMNNYSNTLLDEAYNFAIFCNKKYIQKHNSNLPWGIGESAYFELDNSENYKYKAFATPYLKVREDLDKRLVISPYSSLLGLTIDPSVINNIEKYKKLDMISSYGLYDAYDVDSNNPVKVYYAHHEGMNMLSFTNYLKDNIIKKYFHSNINIKAFEILLKEKVQVRSSIDLEMAKIKKYLYKKETIISNINVYNEDYNNIKQFLSNKKYTLIMDKYGNSLSKYRQININRYRLEDENFGEYLIIKNKNTNKIFSSTYAPFKEKSSKYEVVTSGDKIKYIKKYDDLLIKTEVIVTKRNNAEIRKITLKNLSSNDVNLELTTYMEVLLSLESSDRYHKCFNNLFVKSKWDSNYNALIFKRKERNNNANYYMINSIISDIDYYNYETEKDKFIKRGNSINNKDTFNNKLTNTDGDIIDAISSIRCDINLESNSKKTIYLLTGFGRSSEQVYDIIKFYQNTKNIEDEFKIVSLSSSINIKDMNLNINDIDTFNKLFNYIINIKKQDNDRFNLLRKNALSKNNIWKFSISGDEKIITIQINDIRDIETVISLLKCFEYFKNNSIFVDFIIILNETNEYNKTMKSILEERLYRIYKLNSFYHTKGIVKIIEAKDISESEKILFEVISSLYINIKKHENLNEIINKLDNNFIKIISYNEMTKESKKVNNLLFDNSYGGFNEHLEYLIYDNNTPLPWSNVLANNTFGSIITNNGCGFTYFINSSLFKITEWTNELVENKYSEGFIINNELFSPSSTLHGFGYTTFYNKSKEKDIEILEFIPNYDNIKIYKLKIKNKLKEKQDFNISYFIRPVLGDILTYHNNILCEKINNYINIRNTTSNDFSNVDVFITTNETINSYDYYDINKYININVELFSLEEKEIIFALGATTNNNIEEIINKYDSIDKVDNEFNKVKDRYNNILGRINIKTNNKAFDIMMNKWYLYQVINSRLLAKASFYQVGGAVGFRDQLQDALNIIYIDSTITKNQILDNAKHQFIEGDVLHWYHDYIKFGLRSRYKDDYLWLVYTTLEYIMITSDIEILDEKIIYIDGQKLSDYDKELTLNYYDANIKESLFSHIKRALDLSLKSLGENNLPLMGGGDWNDGMNLVGIKGKGESVWLGFFVVIILKKFIEIVKNYNLKIKLDYYIDKLDLISNGLKKCWDGKYFIRAIYDNGDFLGTHLDTECKIDLISQAFSILSDIADEKQIKEIINSVDENLVDYDKNIIKLLTPPFSKSLNNPGYIMSYPKGIRENGGQYTHAVAWYIMALIKTNNYDKAYKYFNWINPINRGVKEDINNYKLEPFVIAADIYDNDNFYKRGGWSWYTGSAGWFYKVGLENILGFKIINNHLTFNNNYLKISDSYEITYKYKETIYEIKVIKSNINKYMVDGTKSNEIILKNDKKHHKIIIYLK